MTNQLSLPGQMPGVFAGRRSLATEAAQQGIASRGFATIGIKGKIWEIKYKGETEILRDDRKRPLQDLEVVIVAASPYVSRHYYEGGFKDEPGRAPDCYSVNGLEPDPSAAKKQSKLCADCPHAVYGSMITAAGKKAYSCSHRKRLAIVPLGDLENEVYGGPMLLDLPPTSHGNLDEYIKGLLRKGACLEAVATRLSFDAEFAYPKMQFEAIDWLNNEQATVVVGPNGTSGLQIHPAVERMLTDVGVPAVEEEAKPSPLDAPPPAAVQRRLAVVQSDPPAPAPEEPALADEPEEEEAVSTPPPAPPPAEQPTAAAAPPKRQRNTSPAFMVAGAPDPKPAATVVREAPEDMTAVIEAMLAQTV